MKVEIYLNSKRRIRKSYSRIVIFLSIFTIENIWMTFNQTNYLIQNLY